MKPKVSIVTVVYNGIETIEKTINNVLKQTYPNLEYIVVDGASTDGTLDVIKRYSNKLKFVSEKDSGIYDAMQKGAKLATGEWILYRNNGDYFFNPTSIAEVFEKYSDQGEDFILTNARLFKKYGYKDIKPNILTKSYFAGMPVIHPSTFIRRSVQLQNPFHLEYRNSADYCFFIELFSKGARYVYIDVTTSLFDNESGASTTNYLRSIKENIAIMERLHAPVKYISLWKKILKEYKRKQSIKRIFPFYSIYHKWHLRRDGWTKADESYVLENI